MSNTRKSLPAGFGYPLEGHPVISAYTKLALASITRPPHSVDTSVSICVSCAAFNELQHVQQAETVPQAVYHQPDI